ncbi:unnamed protein product [Toxocara canis]|uniref:MICOS complex subunit MIC10 n=1 Tax=Toxocara canis TaxID=6265 RepID=A0A183V2B5_TOXCA|nr:unnamed protein product [Toxocara canis]
MVKPSKEELEEKWDWCFANSLLKITGGLAFGVVASLTLFKGRLFPLWFGSATGMGMGWNDCRYELQNPSLLHGRRVRTNELTANKVSDEYVVVADPPRHCH